jgi:hypothetical protein
VAGDAKRQWRRPPGPELVVVSVDAQLLGQGLRWAAAPAGGPFPHVYAPLPLSAVVAVHRIADASLEDKVLPPGVGRARVTRHSASCHSAAMSALVDASHCPTLPRNGRFCRGCYVGAIRVVR